MLFGLDSDSIDLLVKSGGTALLLSVTDNIRLRITFWKLLKAADARAETERTERREVAKKFQDGLQDDKERIDGNIEIIKYVKVTLDNNTKTLEKLGCRYSPESAK